MPTELSLGTRATSEGTVSPYQRPESVKPTNPVVPRVFPLPEPTPNDAFNDLAMQNLIPPNGRDDVILNTDRICKSTQQEINQTAFSLMLHAPPASKVLLRYQENGHVTLHERDFMAEKPCSGVIWVYGTAASAPEDTLMVIYGRWTRDGTGGDQRGLLLAQSKFDDGACYQINDSKESKRRRSLPQRLHTEGEGNNLWCGIEIILPADLDTGTTYTIYWVWSWPTLLSDSLRWKQEIYTT